MSQIKSVTYNVHGAVGMDGRHLPSRQLDILRRINADCIALQEFVNHPVPEGKQLLDRWADSLGMTGHFAPAFSRGGYVFGNAILSRFPIREMAEHDMSAPGGRPRVALEALLQVGSATLNIITVHCGVRRRTRTLQRALIMALVEQARGDVRLLMGDFNEWHVWNPTFQALRAEYAVGPTLPTFPAMAPALALDRIWVYPRDRLLATSIESRPPARYASDHLPVVATVMI